MGNYTHLDDYFREAHSSMYGARSDVAGKISTLALKKELGEPLTEKEQAVLNGLKKLYGKINGCILIIEDVQEDVKQLYILSGGEM